MVRRLFMLPSFALFTRLGHRFQGRLTASGRVVFLGMVAAGLFSVDTSRTQAFQLFSLLCGLLLLAVAFSLRFTSRLALQRSVPPHATLGHPFECVVEVVNGGRQAQSDLFLLELPPHLPPTLAEFLTSRQPGEEKRNWFDRHVAFERYVWLLRRKQGFSSTATPLPAIPAGGRCRVMLSMTPNRRGRVALPGPGILRPDPLGLFMALEHHPQPTSLLVLPQRYPLPVGFSLPGHRRHQPGGVTMASAVGDAEEFVSLRQYREGDSLRRIHWPGLAHHGKLLVREYQEEYFTRYGLVLDTFASKEQNPAIFEEAVSLAASFSAVVESGDSLLELLFVGQQSYHFTAGRGMAHTAQILEILACVKATPTLSFELLKHLVLSQPAVLSGCVLVLLDWDEHRQTLVKKLDQLNLPLLVLVVTADLNTPLSSPAFHQPASRFYQVAAGDGAALLAGLAR